jgi:prolyl oligopeptidase
MILHGTTRDLAARALLALVLGAIPAGRTRAVQGVEYPKTHTGTVVDDFFGTKVADPYRWLEDTDNPEVQAWVESENSLTRGWLDRLSARPVIVKRLTELLDYPRYSLPSKRGSWYFFAKNTGLQPQSVYYKQKGASGAPEVLLDPNQMSTDGTLSIETIGYTRDGKLVGYGLSQSGSDWVTLHVRDVATGKDRKDALVRCRFTSIVWAPDDSGFWYERYPDPGSVPKGEDEMHQKVYFHKLGDDQKSDRLVYERNDDRELTTGVSGSDDGRFLVFEVDRGTATENEVYVQRLDKPGAGIEPVRTGFDASWDFVETWGDKLYFVTDKDAPRSRLVSIDLGSPDHATVEVVPQERDVLETARLVNGQILLEYMHDAHHALRTCGLDGGAMHEVRLPTIGSIAGLSGHPHDDEVFVGLTSFLFPTQNYKLDFKTGELAVFQEAKIDFDRDAYVAHQVFYESKDGTKVPMFLVHRKGIRLDGENPTWLTGYGGFNVSRTPSFSPSRLFWLEQGGVIALPTLRGGGEFGEEWHRAGMLGSKQNVFDDFIGAAEWLVENGYTRPGRLAIAGGSNGGLLVAACTVQRPDLFGAVLCQVPVTDMLRFQKFTAGAYWKPEYGDPEKADDFKFLYAYSPLHTVKLGTRFPAMLITTADTDTRVQSMHAKKFAATVQAANASDNPILLRVETKAGHGAGKPTAKQIEETADLYGFALDRMGVEVTSGSTRSARRGSGK